MEAPPQTCPCTSRRREFQVRFWYVSKLWTCPSWMPPLAAQPPPRGAQAQVKCCAPEPGGRRRCRGSALPPQNDWSTGRERRSRANRGASQLRFHIMSLWNPGSDYKPTGEGPPTGSGSFRCSAGLTRKLHVNEEQPSLQWRAWDSWGGQGVLKVALG